jgi:hypothetical protein
MIVMITAMAVVAPLVIILGVNDGDDDGGGDDASGGGLADGHRP